METAQTGHLRRLALGTVPLAGESLISWLGAVGRDHGIGREAAARITGITPALSPSGSVLNMRDLVFCLSDQQVAAVGKTTDLSAQAAHDMTWQRFLGTALPRQLPAPEKWYRAAPQQDMRHQIRLHGVSTETLRICPPCLEETGGRWPLSWSLPWAFACPRHRCYRLDHCPECGQPLLCTSSGIQCGRRSGNPDGTRQVCTADLRRLPTVAAEDQELLDLQQHLFDHLESGADRRAARADFADLWAMFCVAVFAGHPDHAEGADKPVQKAFTEFCASRDSQLDRRVWMSQSRSPTPLLFAAAVRIAASIVFAEDPFDAADALCSLRAFPRPDEVSYVRRAWANHHLQRAPQHATRRLKDVITALQAPPYTKLSESLPHRFVGVDTEALEQYPPPPPGTRYLITPDELAYLDPELAQAIWARFAAQAR
ncbi:TniQ family protein [Streptomyces roseoverticillatus]|uniref:TniQ family protein n=1 Tax=Streptomyces roseoverticillatus TaxID=66429 RepID=A0ABV3IPD9_9ACTN